MRTRSRPIAGVLLAATGVAALLVSIAGGHGGGHEPPKPPGPPPKPWYGPGDTHGKPAGPNPSRPSTPGPSAPSPSAPGSSGPGGGPTAKVPTTPITATGLDLTRWDLWWRFNRHEFVHLKDAVWAMPAESAGDDAFFLGHGTKRMIAGALRPTEEELAARVVPALIAVLEKEGQPGVLSGCLMALAKIGALASAEADSAEVIAGFLDSSNQQMSETAALALGVLGEPSSLAALSDLVSDDPRGRRLVGRSKVPMRTRAFAAYGMGMLASSCENPDVRRFAVHRLAHQLVTDDTASHDLGVACVNALGLAELPSVPGHLEAEDPVPPASSSREALLRFLIETFDGTDVDELVKAHLPRVMATIAVGTEGEGRESMRIEVADALMRALENGRTRREVVYGCAIGLGRFGDSSGSPVNKGIVHALERVVISGDTTARNLALMALGRISGRPGPDGSMGQLGRITKLLMRQLSKGKSRTRPWAALALGVQGYRLLELDLTPSSDATAAMRTTFEECGSPEDAGAYALALGLRGDIESSALMMTRLYRFSDDLARGAISLAIGLTGDQEGIGFLHPFLPEAAWRPDFLRPMVIALALLGDKTLVPQLVTQIAETDSSARKGVYAWALAHIGDSRAIDPILEMLADETLPDLTRGIAALGAGFISERDHQPWNAALSIQVNYFANPDSLYAPGGGGILNIR